MQDKNIWKFDNVNIYYNVKYNNEKIFGNLKSWKYIIHKT